MNDLRNIAQQLRLPADQLRTAADLLEQGYQPAFIARYRADEAGNLPGSVLWTLKFALERQHQLDTARKEAMVHLGEGVELDDEGRERIERARTTVDIDVALRCFRARRAARQSGERSGQASQLLEKMIAATAPVTDMNAWVAEQLAVEADQSEALVQQCSRLIGTLLGGDTRLMERMRLAIQKKASIKVENQTETPAKSGRSDKESSPSRAGESPAAAHDEDSGDAHDHESNSDAWAHHDDDLVGDHTDPADHTGDQTEGAEHSESSESTESSHQTEAAHPGESHPMAAQAGSSEPTASGQPGEPNAAAVPAASPAASTPTEDAAVGADAAVADQSGPASGEASHSDATQQAAAAAGASGEPPISLTFATGKKPRDAKLSTGKRKERTQVSAKSLAKLTPRQRRRRWLNSVLQPFRSLKKPLHRLTSYQMLMLGRGQRSQLIRVDLDYDRRSLVNMARDVFVNDSHPLAKWFGEACEQALSGGLLAKVEADALAEEDELAQQKLLEAATDQLRVSLLQRPVKGHRILIVDTVGPNSSCVAIIDARGKCLATQEVVCSSQPSVVSQNVIMLGELVHKHKVTLVALSNGPARRFLVHTVAELMKQSASGRLRWTMVDRGGAEAYATSRQASVELPQLNRRFRAAVWLGRRLQDPLGELLKLDTSRLRLGSYQRELPQEPLKRLVTATLSDCLCVKGVDARYASEQQFSYVPGVSPEVATRLAEIAAKREFVSREALLAELSNWSETGKRQALGFLRIYQSPQTLDGTLIHPDDYRLAQRLIENTDLVEPASAPEGWLPPRIKTPKPSKNFGAEPASGADISAEANAVASSETHLEGATDNVAEAVGAAAETAAAGGSAAEASAVAEPAGQTTASPEAPSPAAAASPDSAAKDTATDTALSDTALSDTALSDTLSDTAASVAGTESTDATEGADAAVSSDDAATSGSPSNIVPEYSEDVISEQAASPTIDVEKLARGWQVGRAKLAWLAECLAEPFGDSRDKRPPVPMLASVPTLADLQPGMSVYAIVVGVAEFGAFVELGPDCGGLIHISRLSARYIEDPHQAVQIGDLIQAWVVSVDVDKKRVALTALSPQQQQQQAEAQRAHDQSRAAESRGPRSGQHSGGQHSGGGHSGGQHTGGGQSSGQRGGGQHAGSQSGGGQRTGGQYAGGGQGRGGRPGGQGGPGQGGGQGSGGGRPGAGQRRDRGGAPGGGHGRGAGRRDGGGESRPIVVKSKKPSAPITEAMKKGQEPLRSFSDLMQYFEVQRTDTPAAAPVVVEPKPAAQPTAQPEASREPPSDSTANE